MKITGSTALYTELAQQHVIRYTLLALHITSFTALAQQNFVQN